MSEFWRCCAIREIESRDESDPDASADVSHKSCSWKNLIVLLPWNAHIGQNVLRNEDERQSDHLVGTAS